ncbi:hypothetical protein COV93_04685 [Candidatus Woesearchaeota archaeon CG11_big_fil_rev_8_21_14_0_20_43_8]|nr:MAG: hypothetical protein COV93_04685 [Candidatus Woesearchaeota archaeon CG11_big_fil_rev_8_21_14_0_20_43_8]PIO06832.1 MAG: hypothetical protein COT47_02570 [Candidatus Woesearchaeota archaeon CG08_land_8_20_14_0_20_43_7]
MAVLIANLSTGKGTWGHVSRLIADGDFDKIFLITNDFGKEKFQNEKGAELISIDVNKPIPELVNDIKGALDGKISDTEVALNLVSGSGKEHMAILSSLLKLGLSVRLYALTRDGVKEV